MAKRKKNYLNNRDLYDEIVISKSLEEGKGKLTTKAEKMLMLIAQRAIGKMKYNNDADREDCLSSAYLDLLKYWRGFNPKYTNAFAYYTEIAKRGFAKGWNKLHPKKYAGTIRLSGANDGDGVYSI